MRYLVQIQTRDEGSFMTIKRFDCVVTAKDVADLTVMGGGLVTARVTDGKGVAARVLDRGVVAARVWDLKKNKRVFYLHRDALSDLTRC